MRSEFDDLCKDARKRIPVPGVPLDAIRRAARHTLPKRPHLHKGILATLLAASSLMAVAVSAHVWNDTRVSINRSGGVMLQFDNDPTTLPATSENLRWAVSRANFPVVLPAGLPRNASLVGLGRIGSSVLSLAYDVPHAGQRDDQLSLWLVNAQESPDAANAPRRRPRYRVEFMHRAALHWRVGDEEVVVTGSGALSHAQLAQMREAMVGSPSLAATVDRAAAELMTKQHVPGVAIAVVEHGAIAYEQGYGYADVGRKTPVTVDTRFEIGSITKQFTAACIMQQVRAGKLSLDDTLGKFIPEYPAGAAVTVRQLLSQTSGIPEYTYYEDKTPPSTFAGVVERTVKKPLRFAPGSRWSYSNTNYIFLGRILELTAHEPYEQYVREHIFGPAHMTQSGFMSEEGTLPDMAAGYQPTATRGVAPARPIAGDWAGAAGAIVSTVGDLAKWDTALTSGEIVPATDVKVMLTSATLSDGSATRYGFGWAVDSFGGHPRVSHNGGTAGFAAINAMFPRDDESIIVLENLALSAPNRAASAIFSALHPDVTAKFNTAVAGEDKTVTARLRELLRRAALGDFDRTQFSKRFLKAFGNRQGKGFVKEELGPLGPVTNTVFRGKRLLPTMTAYDYNVAFGSDREFVNIGIDAQNKITAFGFMTYSDADVSAKPSAPAKEDAAVTARVRDWLRRLATGEIDRSQLSSSFSSFFGPSMAAQTKKDFAKLGAPMAVVFRGQTERSGSTMYSYEAKFARAKVTIVLGIDAQDKITAFAYGVNRVATDRPVTSAR